MLGAETELARRTGAPRHAARVGRLVTAVAARLAPDGVLVGCGLGDGGLFAGITARYLALVATCLPTGTLDLRRARTVAADLVRESAGAAWAHREQIDGLPRFGADWSVPARPAPADLSVQLSAWMLLEAAATLEPGPERPAPG